MMWGRRDVLVGGLIASLATSNPFRIAKAAVSSFFEPKPGTWRRFEITTKVNLVGAEGDMSQAWVPLPSFTATDWIRPIGNKWTLPNGTATERLVGPYGVKMLHVIWSKDDPSPAVTVVSQVATRDRLIEFARPGKPEPLTGAQRALYTRPTQLIPTDGIVKETADKITAGVENEEIKARRIYDWLIANAFRDPTTKGCGPGNIVAMLQTGNFGGKCADINGLYIGLARAAGLPARDLYGIRVAPSSFGYKSLGANSTDITKAQHCRAEVYLSQWGWVPVDPADVLKVMLEEPPGQLSKTDPKVEAVRAMLFGAWETNWIAYNAGHDLLLPGSKQQTVGFLMYPQAETSAGMYDSLDAKTFEYQIETRELSA